MIAVPLLAISVTAEVIIPGKAKKNAAYTRAVQILEAEQYNAVIEAFSAMDGYKNSGAF